ncbi:single-stranded-DNA-specific exonuclease RecJ [Bacillus thuringiensis]|uniref:Single-stranded-DNA-specific exonuclease RecJ n=1 Tax=Bacillus thuringiensis TaxID=1428 RepID=A0A9X6ZQ76_BACTU|nr:DHH family phosphoesterase [Bacillus thuringiensis]PFJ29175.1 hypothetical protein COJ15_32185 [Bacillus thuringiensis]
MTKKWVEKPYDVTKAKVLQQEAKLTSLTSKLLVSRGIETDKQAQLFLKPNFNEDLHNPSLLADIDKVATRIYKAIQKMERVLIHGDYDADGATTTAIYVKGFKLLGKQVDYFLPNRFKDGYGVNVNNVEKFAEYDLIITGDTGIKAYDAIYELTHTHQKDVIVTDHHEPVVFPISERDRIPEKTKVIETEHEVMAIPDCFAVINPKRIDCKYQGKDLSGAGVAFKVIEAVFDYLHYPKRELYQMLDLVACGLVPDMVPMFNTKTDSFEVRNYVKLGLNIMNKSPKRWVTAVQELKEKEKNKNKPKGKARPIVAMDLGFTYGPLLNATGRLYDPTPAAEFLMEEDEEKVNELAKQLHEINLERRKLSADNASEILKFLKEQDEEYIDYGIVVTSPNLHVGITGLVAGEVLKEYYRTTIALAPFINPDGTKVYKGSARSIHGISVLDALIDVEKEMGPYIYGGHEQAAGLTLKPEQLDLFRELFRLAVKKQADKFGPEVFEPKKFYDAKIQFEEINFDLINELNLFEPFGMGNEEPTFYAGDVFIESIKVLRDKETQKEKALKFNFVQDGQFIEGITFSKIKELEKQYEKALERNSMVPCEVLGIPQINEWMGRITFQFKVEDIKIEPSL